MLCVETVWTICGVVLWTASLQIMRRRRVQSELPVGNGRPWQWRRLDVGAPPLWWPSGGCLLIGRRVGGGGVVRCLAVVKDEKRPSVGLGRKEAGDVGWSSSGESSGRSKVVGIELLSRWI